MSSPATELEVLLETWDSLSEEERVQAFEQIPRGRADDFFLALNPRDQAAYEADVRRVMLIDPASIRL